MIAEEQTKKLVDMSLADFADETASESPAPGGGSIAAYAGVLGVSLGTMVANLSAHKRGWDERWEQFSDWAEKGQAFKDELLHLVDEDTRSFNKIMDAFGLPKTSEQEKSDRKQAIEEASKYAMQIPFRVMKRSYESMQVMKAMAVSGNPNSVSDAGVGALCARAAVRGAYMNVRINASGVNDKEFVDKLISEGREIEKAAETLEREIVALVDEKIK